MIPADIREFDQIWLVDFEFKVDAGELPDPICLVAHELSSGRAIRVWQDELKRLNVPPYPITEQSLFVAYFSSAELGCHLALGWPMPAYVLDLYVEFRRLTNGLRTPSGNSLLGALAYFGIGGIGASEKEEMRSLVLRGGPWTESERNALIEYCQSDVVALKSLLPRMVTQIDFPRALLRGRYMKAIAKMEAAGVPIDLEALHKLRSRWPDIKERLISKIDQDYGIYERGTFKANRFEKWLTTKNIPWPRLESGRLALDDNTFREMAKSHPAISPIRELRYSLSQLRLEDLSVGSDARNRVLLSPFSARSGRNAPSTTKFIFGPAVWLRSLIRPPAGQGLAYVDWEQQEFGIAAALSGDTAMMEAYRSGDPYLEFAKQAGAVPPDATKKTHGAIRELFKSCALAVQYGMGEESLGRRLGKPRIEARELLAAHRRVYAKFWEWSDSAVRHAMTLNRLHTVFGWRIQLGAGSKINTRSLMNFPMQANGAELLRLACCLATERGIKICAPVHDAILIEAPIHCLEEEISRTQEAMREASHVILKGFELRTEAKIIAAPDRYMDARGATMWRTVWDSLADAESETTFDGSSVCKPHVHETAAQLVV